MWAADVRATVRAEAVHREEAATRRLRGRRDARASDASDGVHRSAHRARRRAVRRDARIQDARWETRFVRDAAGPKKPARQDAADKSDGCRDAAPKKARVAVDSGAELDRDGG
jgi:hypothetical protein